MKKTNGTGPDHQQPGKNVLDFRPATHSGSDTDPITASDYDQVLVVQADQSTDSFSLQVHLPFCPLRCLSCQCNVKVTHDTAAIDRYLDALQAEIKLVVDRIGTKRKIGRLHIGGGSPNYLNDLQLVRLLSILEESFQFTEDTTMSLVANARLSSKAQLALLRGLGFSQICFPIHDVDPEVQTAIGRIQSFDMLREVFDSARESGFTTIDAEIKYGLPNQNTQSMNRSMKLLKLLEPDRIHCKAFNRMVDAFPHHLATGDSHIPSLADKLALLNVVVEELSSSDFAWIGMDCFTRNDDPLHQAQLEGKLNRNWLGYTLDKTSEILGFGTHSVSEVESLCVQNHLGVDSWSDSLQANRLPIRSGLRFTAAEKNYRRVLTDLMCNLYSDDCSPLMELEDDQRRIDGYRDRGLLEVEGERMSITPQGRFLLPQIWGDTVPGQYRWHYPV